MVDAPTAGDEIPAYEIDAPTFDPPPVDPAIERQARIESAVAKLMALGLTEDEARALGR